jgi:hypothetical protein
VRLYLGSVVGLLVVFAVLLRGAGNGLDVRQYYPMKGLWFLVLVLGPVVAVLVADVGRRLLRPLWLRLDRLGSAARVSRICLAALICAIAFTFWLPQLLGNAALTGTSLTREPVATGRVDRANFTSVSAERYDIATRYVGRYRPAVTVPVAVGMSLGGSADGPHLVSKLMVFQDGQPETLGHPASVCTDVAAVTATGAGAVVMTQMNVATLRAAMQAQGCAGVRVAKIPGGSFDD